MNGVVMGTLQADCTHLVGRALHIPLRDMAHTTCVAVSLWWWLLDFMGRGTQGCQHGKGPRSQSTPSPAHQQHQIFLFDPATERRYENLAILTYPPRPVVAVVLRQTPPQGCAPGPNAATPPWQATSILPHPFTCSDLAVAILAG